MTSDAERRIREAAQAAARKAAQDSARAAKAIAEAAELQNQIYEQQKAANRKKDS